MSHFAHSGTSDSRSFAWFEGKQITQDAFSISQQDLHLKGTLGIKQKFTNNDLAHDLHFIATCTYIFDEVRKDRGRERERERFFSLYYITFFDTLFISLYFLLFPVYRK